MKSLGSTKIKVTKDENGKNVPYLEINEVMLVLLNGWVFVNELIGCEFEFSCCLLVLVHYNIVNNDYQDDLRVFYTFIPNKSFGQPWSCFMAQLLDFLLQNFIFSKTLKNGLLIKIQNR